MGARHLTLLVDTSLSGARLGLQQSASGEVLWSGGSDETQGSAARLPALLNSGLDAIGEQILSITSVVVSTGPGSFTGIRVGIAFAKGVAAGLAIPVTGCSSLGLLAQAFTDQDGAPSALLLAATATHGYAAFTDVEDKPALLSAAAAGHVPWPSAWVDGDGHFRDDAGAIVRVFGSWLAMEQYLGSLRIPFSTLPVSPVADQAIAVMGRMAASLSVPGVNGPAGYFERQIEPIYLRRSSVEEKLAGAGGAQSAAIPAGGAL